MQQRDRRVVRRQVGHRASQSSQVRDVLRFATEQQTQSLGPEFAFFDVRGLRQNRLQVRSPVERNDASESDWLARKWLQLFSTVADSDQSGQVATGRRARNDDSAAIESESLWSVVKKVNGPLDIQCLSREFRRLRQSVVDARDRVAQFQHRLNRHAVLAAAAPGTAVNPDDQNGAAFGLGPNFAAVFLVQDVSRRVEVQFEVPALAGIVKDVSLNLRCGIVAGFGGVLGDANRGCQQNPTRRRGESGTGSPALGREWLADCLHAEQRMSARKPRVWACHHVVSRHTYALQFSAILAATTAPRRKTISTHFTIQNHWKVDPAMADVLQVQKRQKLGTNETRRLRKSGHVPAVLYGHGEANEHLAIPSDNIKLLLRHHSKTVELKGDVTETALVSNMQWDPLGIEVIHLDLIRVNLKEKVTISVPIHVHGDAPGVREGGMLLENQHEVEISCPAGSIPESLQIDVNDLQLGGHCTAGQLTLPSDVELVTPAEMVIVHVEAPKGGGDDEATEDGLGAEPEVIAKGGEKAEE